MKLIAALCVVVVLTVSAQAQGGEKDAMKKVKAGVDAGKAILDFLSNENNSKYFKAIGAIAGKIGPFLGAIGPALSIILMFLPQSPSQELQLMKKEFAKIDAKFDQVFDKLEEVKNLIQETSLKNQYSRYEHTILSLSHKLQLFLNQSFQTANTFKEDFINEYETTHGGATYKIYNGIIDKGVLSDNIPFTIMKYTRNHRRRTQKIMKGVINLIMQGVKVILAYHKAKGNDVHYYAKKSEWEYNIKKLLNHTMKMDTKVKDRWHDELKRNIDSELASKYKQNNKDFANHLYSFLIDKFDWRVWHVVAYDELSGKEHHIGHCGGYHRFRKHGRNLVVASVEQRKEAINRLTTLRQLRYVSTEVCLTLPWSTRKCYDRDADKIYEQFPKDFRDGCRIASLGVIKKDSGIAHKAPGNRLAKVEINNFQLYAFG